MRITARSAIVVDLKEGTVLWSKNSALVHPLASITKLMTAVVAAERLPTNASLTVSAEDLTPEGESNLLVGDRWRLRDLLSFTLVTSSNDGAHALANAVQATTQSALAPSTTTQQSAPSFVDAMNIKADQLAMHQTVFRNETGLDESATVSGADGTVGDVAALLRYMHEHHQNLLYPTAEPSVSLSSEITQYKAVNTNPTLEAVDGIIGSKTGYTDLAGGNLAIVFDADIDRPVGVVVLGSTISERFTDVAALTQAARHWYRIQYP
jgi:D-alanyl-D-alanine carboxypeptidase (penicillin-binding protein 5/6)